MFKRFKGLGYNDQQIGSIKKKRVRMKNNIVSMKNKRVSMKPTLPPSIKKNRVSMKKTSWILALK